MLLDLDSKRGQIADAIWLLFDKRFGPTRVEKLRTCVKLGRGFKPYGIQTASLTVLTDIAVYAPKSVLSMLDTVDRLRDSIKAKKHVKALDAQRERSAYFMREMRERYKLGVLVHEWEKKNRTHDIKAKLTYAERKEAEELVKREISAKRAFDMEEYLKKCEAEGVHPAKMDQIRKSSAEIGAALEAGLKAQKKQFYAWLQHQNKKHGKAIVSLNDLDKFDN